MALDAHGIAARSGRPAEALTRRDVARGLLGARAADALAELPGLRRQLIAAGNPLTAAFWDSAADTLRKIAEDTATVGDVRQWLEATGTEPAAIIGMHVWDAEPDRSPVQAEIHARLVAHLEELLAAGQIDPDELATGDDTALHHHRRLQERWMMAPQPDGRVPMWVVLDESDEEFLAEWDAAEAAALAELRANLSELPGRAAPEPELREACERIRAAMKTPAWPQALLCACGGVQPGSLPRDDAELWLTLAAGIVSPQDELPPEDNPEDDQGDYAELTGDQEAMVALCALDHYDWLAVASAAARRGPGAPAGESALAGYVSEYDPDEVDDQADAAEGMFLHAVGLLQVLGAIDDRSRLTTLGWWGIPEAVQRAWQPKE